MGAIHDGLLHMAKAEAIDDGEGYSSVKVSMDDHSAPINRHDVGGLGENLGGLLDAEMLFVK